ncbi:MAG: hypothetical protein ACK4IT_00550 [Thioalkalivibrionaceae bacterium]
MNNLFLNRLKAATFVVVVRRSKTVSPYALRGVTLVELMIALTLGLLALLAAIGVFEANQRVINEKSQIDRAQDTMRYSSTLLGRLIRNAESVLPGSNAGSLRLITRGAPGIVDCFGTPRPSGRFAMNLTVDSEPTSGQPVFVLTCAIDEDVPDGQVPTFGPAQVLARWIPQTEFLFAERPANNGCGQWSTVGAFSTTPPADAQMTHAVRIVMVAPGQDSLLMTATLRSSVVAMDQKNTDCT